MGLSIGQLEKNLKNKDLSVFKTEPIKLVAKQVVQYQDFRIGAALERINGMGLSQTTLKNYFNMGRAYIKKGVKNSSCSQRLYDEIDFWTGQKLQPLTPSLQDKSLLAITTSSNKRVAQPVSVSNSVKEKKLSNKMVIPTIEALSEQTAQPRSFAEKLAELRKEELDLKDRYCALYEEEIKNLRKDCYSSDSLCL